MKIEKSWQLSNSVDEYKEFNHEFNSFLEENNVEAGGNYALNVAVEELVTNTIKYNPDVEGIKIDITLVLDSSEIELSIVDNAGAFDINSAKKPDLSKDISDIEIGGLGVELVKNLFHSCEYCYIENSNSVKLVYVLPEEL